MRVLCVMVIVMLVMLPGCVPIQRGATAGAQAAFMDGPPVVEAPPDMSWPQALGYTVSALVAYVVGSIAKAYIRKRAAEKEADTTSPPAT